MRNGRRQALAVVPPADARRAWVSCNYSRWQRSHALAIPIKSTPHESVTRVASPQFCVFPERTDLRADRLLDPADRARLAGLPADRQRDAAPRGRFRIEPAGAAAGGGRRTVGGRS